MVVANNEIGDNKNAGKSTTISMTMAIQRYDARRIARWSTSRASLELSKPLDAAIGRVPAPYRLDGRHG